MRKIYWILIILGAVLLPFGLNWLILQPSRFEVVGDGTHWLSFWGGYIGAIFSAGIAFFILDRQIKANREINTSNQTLQLDLNYLDYKKQRFRDLEIALYDYIDSIKLSEISDVINDIVKRESMQKNIFILKEILPKYKKQHTLAFFSISEVELDKELTQIFIEKSNLIFSDFNCLMPDLIILCNLLNEIKQVNINRKQVVNHLIAEYESNFNGLTTTGIIESIKELDNYNDIEFRIGELMNDTIRKICNSLRNNVGEIDCIAVKIIAESRKMVAQINNDIRRKYGTK